MLKGKKVTLRPIREENLNDFIAWFNDMEVTRYLISYLPMTEASEKKWIEETTTKRKPVFVIEARDEEGRETSIGVCGLNRVNYKDGNAELGITIGEKKYWGKGLGTEALTLLIDYGFNFLNLHKIYSGAIEPNIGSIKLHQKLGFVQEGKRKEQAFSNGQYLDLIEFGLLREEWKELK